MASKLSSAAAHIKAIASSPIEYLRAFQSLTGTTDVVRWSELRNFSPSWDERTRMIAAMIPDGSAVIEFGAGRMTLRDHLGPTCTYQPCDLVKRTEETLTFDLNQDLPDLANSYDYAVISGVLEYIHNPRRLLYWLAGVATHVIFSYAPIDSLSDPITRRKSGWVNSLSDRDIRELIASTALELVDVKAWDGQRIYFCRSLLARK